MPIEIKELVIRAVVDDDDRLPAEPGLGEEAADELVEACVREVLRVLKRSGER